MDLKIQGKVLEHLYHVVMQKPFAPCVPFTPQKKEFTGMSISQQFPRKSPEALGFDSAHFMQFLKELESKKELNIHQVMVVRDHAVICEAAFAPYRMELWHVTHSLCKTITAMAVGILVGDGALSLSDKVAKIFEKRMPALAWLKIGKLEVRHLLTMSSGATVNESLLCAEEDWVTAYLDTALHFEPGSKFQYNSINSYMLSCIVEELSGKTMLEFLKERLFAPMGIETVQWESCPKGHTKGGWGMYLLPEDMAKLGVLLMQKGVWKGQGLISADYVTQMTQKQIDTAPEEEMFGYGYQVWMGKKPGVFLFNGMLGQNVHVLPADNMVIVVTGGNDKLFGNCAVNEIIYRYFYDHPLPPAGGNRMSSKALTDMKSSLKNANACFGQKPYTAASFVAMLRRGSRAPVPEPALKLAGRRFRFDKPNARFQPLFAQFLNNSYTKGVSEVGFSMKGDRLIMSVTEGDEVNHIAVGFLNPEYAKIVVCGEPYLVAAQGLFTKDEDDTDVLKITIPFIEHSNGRLMKIFFVDDEHIRVEWNEFPGRAVLSDGAQVMLGSISDSVLNQVTSHVDLDLVMSLADSLMEPVSYGVLVK